ncbi:hypothetical protein [Actinomadura opuntiae]|uniref:hypothetical protein n=1 Tax=Actinomadura sp. OS1-43 TaxID=604315 RepID=UPI00255B1970|nr:hypothetical protein [Actinomadura sp. OS1-43]MDL4818427.1 hypothetical protein [Actinomadura sp. OS1-43]
MGALALATAAPVAYVAGFTVFKLSGRRMPRLTGSRLFHTTGTLATSPAWLFGLALLIGGMVVQSIVLTRVPVSVVVPMYGPVMVVLLLIAVTNFRERVTPGELGALSVLVLALLAFAAAGGLLSGSIPAGPAGPWRPDAPLWKIALLIGPSLVFPLWLFVVRDSPVDGRHAKRVTGVAFGLGAGVLVGCAESSGAAIARLMRHDPSGWGHVLGTPHPYIVVVTGLLGAGLAHIGLQRCRLSVVIIMLAVGSKASLWLGGILVYGQPWPQTPVKFALSAVGLVLAAASVFTIPRHEREAPVTEEAVAPAQAPLAPPRPAPRPDWAPMLSAPVMEPRPAVPRSAAAMRYEAMQYEAMRDEAARRRPG